MPQGNQMKIRNNILVDDPRLDRIEFFDERSRNFPVRSPGTHEKKLRSYTWRCFATLDQGSEGSCVGHAVAHELLARPAEVCEEEVNHEYARETIYWGAQKIDYWAGGAYPGAHPFYEGTSVLHGVKVAHKLGWFDSYRWAFGLRDLQLGVGYHGPAVLGVSWYEGMFFPDENGFIHPTGRRCGGHALLCNSISVKNNRFTLHNSWGPNWGINGECYISFEDMDKLLNERGEAVFMLHRHGKQDV